jgi:predicted RNase H-like nuclease (RuvC/YqgF family)
MTDKQLNIRLPEDLKAKFDELAKSSGLKQGELFAMLLDLADKDALKALVPDAATDIDAFDAHVHALRDAYVAAIMRAKDAYTIASDKVRNELNTFAALTQQNQQMQVENLTLSKKLKDAKNEIARLKIDLASAQVITNDATTMKQQIVNLREQIVTLREEHAAELEKVRAEGFAQLLEVLKTQQQK